MSAVRLTDRIRQWLDQCAEHWIGYAFPPPQRAIEHAEWQPDTADHYCHRCGDSVAPGEATDTGCATCRSGAELAGGIADGVLRLGPYIDPLQQWIRAIKYQQWIEMGEHLGQQLGESIAASHLLQLDRTIIVPMPMPWQRRMYRGVDHAAVLARGVSRQLNVPLISVLARRNYTPQVALVPSARKRTSARSLRIRRRFWRSRAAAGEMRELHIVLVDDVRTTGATLKAATRLLRTLKPAKIICAVIAVSDSKARRDRNQLRTMTAAGKTIEKQAADVEPKVGAAAEAAHNASVLKHQAGNVQKVD